MRPAKYKNPQLRCQLVLLMSVFLTREGASCHSPLSGTVGATLASGTPVVRLSWLAGIASPPCSRQTVAFSCNKLQICKHCRSGSCGTPFWLPGSVPCEGT